MKKPLIIIAKMLAVTLLFGVVFGLLLYSFVDAHVSLYGLTTKQATELLYKPVFSLIHFVIFLWATIVVFYGIILILSHRPKN